MVRVGVTGLSGKSFRAWSVEESLLGKAPAEADIVAASKHVAQGVEASADLQASSEYRKHLARIYTRRALTEAASRMK